MLSAKLAGKFQTQPGDCLVCDATEPGGTRGRVQSYFQASHRQCGRGGEPGHRAGTVKGVRPSARPACLGRGGSDIQEHFQSWFEWRLRVVRPANMTGNPRLPCHGARSSDKATTAATHARMTCSQLMAHDGTRNHAVDIFAPDRKFELLRTVSKDSPPQTLAIHSTIRCNDGCRGNSGRERAVQREAGATECAGGRGAPPCGLP